MLTATQIAAIIMLLQAFGVGQPTLANVHAILAAGSAQHQTTSGPATAAGSHAPATSTAQSPSTAPAAVIAPAQGVEQSEATSTSPIPGTIVVFNAGSYLDGVAAQHYAAPAGTTLGTASDGEFVTVGAIVYDTAGIVDCASVVTATTSDPTQDRTWYSTPSRDQYGNCYYAYQYLFKWPGQHTVEFESQDASTTLEMTAQ